MSNDDRTLLARTLGELLDAHAAPTVVRDSDERWPDGLWSALEDFGAFRLGLEPDLGGVGGTSADAAIAVRVAARHAAPVPLAETALLGGWALIREGLSLPDGVITVAVPSPRFGLTGSRVGGSLRVDGSVDRVPWARFAGTVVALCSVGTETAVVALPTRDLLIEHAHNLAGEPRDRIEVTGLLVPAGSWSVSDLAPDILLHRAIACRALSMCGAGERILELTVEHTRIRRQFGRSLSSFQAIQQSLAQLAGAVGAAQGAAHIAARALDAASAEVCRHDAVTAKIVASDSATKIAAIAHQLHGAIGMTREYDLQLHTRRLWSWRDEFGTEHHWARQYGHSIAAGGGDPWETLVPTAANFAGGT